MTLWRIIILTAYYIIIRPERITRGPILSCLRASTTLTTLIEQGRLHRKGSRWSAVYLSKDPEKRRSQERTPRKREGAHQSKTADISVQELLAAVWRHEMTAEEAASTLRPEKRTAGRAHDHS